MKAIDFEMLSKTEQDIYNTILSICSRDTREGRDLQDLIYWVTCFTTTYGRSMEDLYFKTVYDDHSSLPRVWYNQLDYLLSIGCRYAIPPLSLLCYDALSVDVPSDQTITVDMANYLLEQGANPNTSMLVYLPVVRPSRYYTQPCTWKMFPFELETVDTRGHIRMFSYQSVKVMYYETLFETLTAGTDDENEHTPLQKTLYTLLSTYGASNTIRKYTFF